MSNAQLIHVLSSAYSSSTLDEQQRYHRRLLRLRDAVDHFHAQGADRHRVLQDALKDVTLPDGINMQNVLSWITQEVEQIEIKIAETQMIQQHMSMLREQDQIVRAAQKRATFLRRQLKRLVGNAAMA